MATLAGEGELSMQVVILCGGQGTRIRHVAEDARAMEDSASQATRAMIVALIEGRR
jgi:hypothetical protein